MEISNLQHLNINSLVTSPLSLSWSEDNKIAVITKEGLVIMVFCPEPGSDQGRLPLQRMIASVTDKSPVSYAQVSTNGLIARMDKQDVYQLIMDTALDPHLQGTQPVAPQIVHHCWSPAGALRNSRCMLAVVTTRGQCSLLSQCVNQWPSVGDVSQAIANHFMENWKEVKETERPDRRFKYLQQRADLLLTMAVCWGLRTCNDYTPLVAAQRSGDLVLLSVSREGKPTVQTSFPTHLNGITALQVLSENLIAVGDRTGCVKLLTLPSVQPDATSTPATDSSQKDSMHTSDIHLSHVNIPEEMDCSTSDGPTTNPGAVFDNENKDLPAVASTQQSEDSETGDVNPEPRYTIEERDLWVDQDKLMVSHLLRLPHALVAFKGGYLVAFSLIDFSITTHMIDSFSIAGGVVLSDQCVAIATQYSGEIVVATVTKDAITCERIKVNPQVKGTMACGLARSKGGALWAVLTSNNQASDRSASVVNFFNFDKLVDSVPNMLKSPIQNLSRWYDHLEVVRISIMNKKTFAQSLPPSPDRFDGLSLYQMRLWRWIYLMKASLMKKLEKLDNRPFSGPEEQHPLESIAASIESLILANHLCGLVESVATRCQVGAASSKWELESALLAYSYLVMVLPDLASNPGPSVKRVRRVLSTILPATIPVVELCFLCGAESTLNNYESSMCTNQHTVPRCSLTLLQMDQIKYLLCGVCGRIAHPQAASFSALPQPPTCIFCDNTLELVEYPGHVPDTSQPLNESQSMTIV